MKKSTLLTAIAVVAIVSCNKTTNNTTVYEPMPAFTVNGVHDLVFTNGAFTYDNGFELAVQYSDSAQEVVTLSLSSLPAGITMDTTWITSGIPTYNTELMLFDTTATGAAPGIYPMTLTATGTATGKKTYAFNIKVNAQAPCT